MKAKTGCLGLVTIGSQKALSPASPKFLQASQLVSFFAHAVVSRLPRDCALPCASNRGSSHCHSCRGYPWAYLWAAVGAEGGGRPSWVAWLDL